MSKTKVDVCKSQNHGWTYTNLWNHHLADDQQGLCEMVVTMDKLNGKAYATELVGTE